MNKCCIYLNNMVSRSAELNCPRGAGLGSVLLEVTNCIFERDSMANHGWSQLRTVERIRRYVCVFVLCFVFCVCVLCFVCVCCDLTYYTCYTIYE